MVYKSGQIFSPFCHNSRLWQTDGRTDRILIARPRLHYMQRGKNGFEIFRNFVNYESLKVKIFILHLYLLIYDNVE